MRRRYLICYKDPSDASWEAQRSWGEFFLFQIPALCRRLSESYSRNVGVAEADLLLFYSVRIHKEDLPTTSAGGLRSPKQRSRRRESLCVQRELKTVEVRLDKCPLDYDVRENDVVKVRKERTFGGAFLGGL